MYLIFRLALSLLFVTFVLRCHEAEATHVDQGDPARSPRQPSRQVSTSLRLDRGEVPLDKAPNSQGTKAPEVESDPCPICLEELPPKLLYGPDFGPSDQRRRVSTRCRHDFHLGCLHKADKRHTITERKCPICRRPRERSMVDDLPSNADIVREMHRTFGDLERAVQAASQAQRTFTGLRGTGMHLDIYPSLPKLEEELRREIEISQRELRVSPVSIREAHDDLRQGAPPVRLMDGRRAYFRQGRHLRRTLHRFTARRAERTRRIIDLTARMQAFIDQMQAQSSSSSSL